MPDYGSIAWETNDYFRRQEANRGDVVEGHKEQRREKRSEPIMSRNWGDAGKVGENEFSRRRRTGLSAKPNKGTFGSTHDANLGFFFSDAPFKAQPPRLI